MKGRLIVRSAQAWLGSVLQDNASVDFVYGERQSLAVARESARLTLPVLALLPTRRGARHHRHLRPPVRNEQHRPHARALLVVAQRTRP